MSRDGQTIHRDFVTTSSHASLVAVLVKDLLKIGLVRRDVYP